MKPEAKPARSETRGSREDVLQRYDTKKDGKIDDAERIAAIKARRMQAGAGVERKGPAAPDDANGRLEKLRRERAQALKAGKDSNGDRKVFAEGIDESERKLMRMRDPDARREALMKRFDKDGDGELSVEEKLSLDEFRKKMLEKRRKT